MSLVLLAVLWIVVSVMEVAVPRPQRPCPSTYVTRDTGRWVRCRLDRGHDGPHEAIVSGALIVWPNR